MIEREREAETQAEGEAGSMQGTQHGTKSQDSRIMHRAGLELHRDRAQIWLFYSLIPSSWNGTERVFVQ